METAHLPTRSTAGSGGLSQALRRHPLIGYFVLALGITWLYVLLLLIRPGLPVAPAAIGPTAAAFIMTALTGGWPATRELLRRMVRWRVGSVWYLFTLVVIPLVYLLGAIIVAGGLPAVPGSLLLRLARGYPIWFVMILVIGGPLFEEPGWRGFALPRLQQRYGPLAGSLILGLLWGLWHMPMYLLPSFSTENGGLSLSAIGVFLLGALTFTVIMTWVFNHTRGSVLLAILVHTSINIFQLVVNQLYPSQADSEVNILIGFGVLALAILIATRGRLGYRDAHGQAVPGAVVEI
jgi:membrane protease YdiL (CAAX protease family)